MVRLKLELIKWRVRQDIVLQRNRQSMHSNLLSIQKNKTGICVDPTGEFGGKIKSGSECEKLRRETASQLSFETG